MKMEDAIVLYSTPEHLNSLSHLAFFFAKCRPSISVVLLSTAASPPIPSVTFHRLPTPDLPPNSTYNHVELFFEIPRNNNPDFRQVLAQISRKSNIRAIVLDFFCNYAFDVAASFSIPTYYCNTTGASSLCALLYWPTIHADTGGRLDDVVSIPGCPLIPSVQLPEMLLSPQSLSYQHFLDTAANIEKSAGIIVNTCLALEQRAVEALNNGLCSLNARTPPVYPLGPLIDVDNDRKEEGVAQHECVRWLDLQPSKSVVFLCFGRRGGFSPKQLREMAVGLENCGYRFLWAVQNPELEALLPEGFLQRTRERGVVMKSWAPQTEVLSHDSVGGFVTHCGQSSMLEALSFGVPMIGWPLYAEQKMNLIFMVEEMKVALPVEKTAEGFVTAAELEKRVRELMESERGKEIRRRVGEIKFSMAAALKEGGSSAVALDNFLATIIEVHEDCGDDLISSELMPNYRDVFHTMEWFDSRESLINWVRERAIPLGINCCHCS